jgi:hypothetical protein
VFLLITGELVELVRRRFARQFARHQ